MTTVYFQTSNRAVIIRLSVLDQEREVTSRTGQGHVSIPAFFFLTNNGEHPSAIITEINKTRLPSTFVDHDFKI